FLCPRSAIGKTRLCLRLVLRRSSSKGLCRFESYRGHAFQSTRSLLTRPRVMTAKDKRPRKKANENASSNREKLSLFPLSIEDALRAAARTGPPSSNKPKRKKRTAPKS